MMDRPIRILVLCSRNKRRSRTAETLFRNDPRMEIRSAGLSPDSTRRVTETDLRWADRILVMEDKHARRLREEWQHLQLNRLEVLHIEDEYAYMDDELVSLLNDLIPLICNHASQYHPGSRGFTAQSAGIC